MPKHYLGLATDWRYFLAMLALLAAGAARAQGVAPAWQGAVASTPSNAYPSYGPNRIWAVAPDAEGNVFVVGTFRQTLILGSDTLTSAGESDLFVAKYAPGPNAWVWAVRGGGRLVDAGYGLAVSGHSVYVTGTFTNDRRNTNAATFGTATGAVVVGGASATSSQDIVVARYTDLGSRPRLDWTQVAGGKAADYGSGLAVSGSSVYLTGAIINDTYNTAAVVFGGDGTTAGTVPQYGVSSSYFGDLVVARYTDLGDHARLDWTQVAGSDNTDYGSNLAVSGSSVYVLGTFVNNRNDEYHGRFGGTGSTVGTVRQAGCGLAASPDLVVAKYTDQGDHATVGWTQVAGGTGDDYAGAIAASGSSVYVTGNITNNLANANAVVFGGSGTTPGTVAQAGAVAVASTGSSPDLVVARYTDLGSRARLDWTQVAGGKADDAGYGIAVQGSRVYVTGYVTNNLPNANAVVFGGTGTTPGTATQAGTSADTFADLLVARYTDHGTAATFDWSRVGGGPSPSNDYGFGVALSGPRVYVGGAVGTPITFGSTTFTESGSSGLVALAYLTDPTLLPTRAATPAGAALTLHPNPAPGAALLSGTAPGATVQVLDALGRVVATATADVGGATRLPAGLAPGVYVVRAGGAAVRWAVE